MIATITTLSIGTRVMSDGVSKNCPGPGLSPGVSALDSTPVPGRVLQGRLEHPNGRTF